MLRIATVALATAVVPMLAGLPSAAAAGTACDYVASPSGSDHARGTSARPLRTVQRLANRLRPGQVGCVRGGSYHESVSISHGGTGNSRRVTIESYPGERATLVGRLYIRRRAPYVTIANMNLNGRNRASLPSPDIVGESDWFIGNDVTNDHTEICFILGSPGYGRARNTLIKGNRIHDCGLLPSRNEDHGIYVAYADNTSIVDNVIFQNTDRGIQLYPDAQGTSIAHNIIDANGENIAFGGERTSSNNSIVQFNLITNAIIGYDVQSYFPGPIGHNNVVKSNCVFGGRQGIFFREKGFAAAGLGNTVVNPRYASAAHGDYSVPAGNRCAAYVEPGTPVTPFSR